MIRKHNTHTNNIVSYFLLLSCTVFLTSCFNNEPAEQSGKVEISQYQGQWMIVNYWAIWCKPCIEEIPELNHFARMQAGKAVVLGVDFDLNSGPQLQAAITKLNIEFPVLDNDPATVLNYPRPQVLPTTLVFNPNGELVSTLVGPQTYQSLLNTFNHLSQQWHSS